MAFLLTNAIYLNLVIHYFVVSLTVNQTAQSSFDGFVRYSVKRFDVTLETVNNFTLSWLDIQTQSIFRFDSLGLDFGDHQSTKISGNKREKKSSRLSIDSNLLSSS
jgi:hypothetical protein